MQLFRTANRRYLRRMWHHKGLLRLLNSVHREEKLRFSGIVPTNRRQIARPIRTVRRQINQWQLLRRSGVCTTAENGNNTSNKFHLTWLQRIFNRAVIWSSTVPTTTTEYLLTKLKTRREE